MSIGKDVDEEKSAFPRGGNKRPLPSSKIDSELLQQKRKKKITENNDDLFKISSSSSDQKQRKSKKTSKTDVKKNDGFDPTVRSAERITYSSLSEGMIVLAIVNRIRDYEVQLSLPGRISATLPITEISQSYTDRLRLLTTMTGNDQDEANEIRTLDEMMQPGMVLPVKITEVSNDGKSSFYYRVKVTAYPSKVNGSLHSVTNLIPNSVLMGAIKSIEDHGYIIDLGIEKARAFMAHKKAVQYRDRVLQGREFGIGELVPCLITNVDPESGTVRVSSNPNKRKAAIVDSSSSSINFPIHAIYPGMTFKVHFEEKIKNGIKVKFGKNNYTAIIHDDDIEDGIMDLESGDLEAQILYIVPTINTIYATLKKELKPGFRIEQDTSHSIGDLISDCRVIKVDKNGLTLKSSSNSVICVSMTNTTDNKDVIPLKDFKTRYQPGSVVKSVRIIQYDYLSRHFIGSMQKSALNYGLISALRPGDKVNCVIKSFMNNGVIVSMMDGKSKAFIPSLHLTDVPTKNPELKFSIGDKLTCKVLRSDSEKKKLHLTSKSILVQENFNIVSEFDSKLVGVVTEGVVVMVKENGLLLQLFGDVQGWVPKSMMSTESIDYPRKLFFLGQTLKCKVVKVDPENRKMILTLILGGQNKPIDHKQRAQSVNVTIGTKYDCIVSEVADDGLTVDIDSKNGIVTGFIPKQHLTDHASLADALLRTYDVGDKIKGSLCFEKDVLPIFTIKPSLLRFDQSRIQSFDDFHEGMVIPGVVNLIKDYGIFIKLPTLHFQKGALIPKRHLADFFVKDITDVVTNRQTVFGKIIGLDSSEKKKITMSSKVKDVKDVNRDESKDVVISYLEDCSRIYSKLSKKGPGDVVKGIVKEKTEFGVFVDVDGGFMGVITNTNMKLSGSNLEEGDSVSAVILNVDFSANVLELFTNLPSKNDPSTLTKLGRRNGYKIRAKPVYGRPELPYVVMMIESPIEYNGVLVYVPCRKHINDWNEDNSDRLFNDIKSYDLIIVEDSKWNIAIPSIDSRNSKKRKHSKGNGDINVEALKKLKVMDEKPTKKETDEIKDDDDDDDEKEMEIEIKDPDWNDEDYNPWNNEPILNKGRCNEELEDDTKGKWKTHISKKEKRELNKLEDEEIKRVEERILTGNDEREPETIEEFERAVLFNPDSSLIWIRFMAHYLDIRKNRDEARTVAKRALEKINFRLEDERLNVYLAWFNLENSASENGQDEIVEKLLKEILRYNDQYTVYTRVAEIYEKTGKLEKAENILKTMVRKFGKELEAWTKLGLYYFKVGNVKEARFTLQRSIQNLADKKEHVAITAQFGRMEFEYGDVERGKTVFETIITNYPKRIDLWMVYVDAVIKANDVDSARDLFERMITLNLQPKRMKTIFKKYIEFEADRNNDEFKADRIRKKALEYVEAKVARE